MQSTSPRPAEEHLEIAVLGPLEVTVAGRPVAVGGPRLRTVLARLLVDAGTPVSLAALVRELWGDHPPQDAERTARTYVSRLRAALPPADPSTGPAPGGWVLTRPPGYQLQVALASIDAARFEDLVSSGRRALATGRAVLASQLLATAQSMWRGPAYGEFEAFPTLAMEGARLEGLRLDALEERIQSDLTVGLGTELVAELDWLVTRHPLRERLWGHLMTALYRSGRQAEALFAFTRARGVLLEGFGIDPSPTLADIHRRILTHDPTLAGPRW